MSLADDLRRAAALGPRVGFDLFRAVAELAIARLRLSAQGPERLLAAGNDSPHANLSPIQTHLIDRVAFAIPRAAARVPWRATCLVQALAARRWLAREGIASQLVLGARKDGDALDAHAWLTVGDRVVIGGDVSGHQPFRPGRS